MTTADLITKLYGVETIEEDTPLSSSVTTTPIRILDNNPGGLQVTIINLGTDDIFIWTDPTVSSSNGILLAASGGSYEIDFTRFMRMPSREWWAVAKTTSSTVAVKRTSIK